jgi:hypothetical protein
MNGKTWMYAVDKWMDGAIGGCTDTTNSVANLPLFSFAILWYCAANRHTANSPVGSVAPSLPFFLRITE